VFYNATPVITAAGANNDVAILTFASIPVTTAEQVITGTAVSNTVLFSAFITVALNRLLFDAGVYDFTIWAGVDSISGGSVTTITRQIYTATPFVVGTVTTTGTGSSRTATASSGTPFATSVIDASATNTVASYLQTPQGLYQITARTSDTEVTITTPSGYTNESAVAGTVWKKLFGITTPEITSISPNYTDFGVITTQPSTVVTTATKMGILGFVTSDATRTISLTYNGEDRNTHVDTPLANLHNDLAGLQGGAATEYFHSTSAEYTGTGTGVFVRTTSPTLVTPALGTPSALVGTSITGTAAGLTAGTVTTNANLTGEATSVGNAATLTNSAVIGKVLTGYTSGAGTVAATDTILQAIQKLNGNTAAVPGTVTSVSVVSNNGFAGTVATATTTPAITLTTTVTGILKGSNVSGIVSAAVAADFPTLNQNTSGNAATATNQSGGTVNATTGVYSGLITGATATVADINNANDAGSMSIRGNASFPASVTFHRTGAYAINVGLSTANNFVIGGWSASANAFSMTGGGALTMLGSVAGTNITAGGNITGSSASCAGNAATATSLTSGNFITQKGSQGSWNADFQATPAGTTSYNGDVGANTTNGPGGTWWMQGNFRHTNGGNYWGTQVAWGWEDNANKLATRNVSNGSFGAWVYYLNSANYASYSPIPAGTAMVFRQTAAPTGWTKVLTNDNSALRVVTGAASTGGSVAFTTAFASQAVAGTNGVSGATTLSESQMPSHVHTQKGGNQGAGLVGYNAGATGACGLTAGSTLYAGYIGATGGGTSHNHSAAAFTGTAINLAVAYVDVIVATKD
jgi:hypothetical protein